MPARTVPDPMSGPILIEEFSIGGDGLRVAVKDTIDIAGRPTRCGSRALADAAPAGRNAKVVDALLAAGCRIVGKANLHELAFGVTGVNAYTGTPPNPRFPGRIPGGSSSGSAAAVAAGLADFALGTDTGGSVRIPACCCGVHGFKPTFGRVNRRGVQPPASSLDCVGPFAATAAMLTRAMTIIDPTFSPETLDHTPCLGAVAVEASPDVAAAVDTALAASGAAVTPVALAGMKAAYAAGLTIINRENWQALGALVTSPAGEAIGPDVRSRLLAASATTNEAVAEAEAIRAAVSDEIDSALEGYDALVMPTMPDVPPRLEEASDARAAIRITALVRAFNLTGHPALTVPLMTADGLPAGLQLIGRKGDDARLCALAEWLEARLAPAAFPTSPEA